MRGLPRFVISALVVAATAACATALATVLPRGQTANVAASPGITLADDANGAALFTLSNLAPGQTYSRCLRLDYQGDTPADIRVSGAGSGGLAPYLDLTVETGDGGGFGNCAAFSGTPVYVGTVGDLIHNHSDYESAVSLWSSLPQGAGVLRVTAKVDNAAPQAQAAILNLSIEARTGGTLTVAPVPTTVPPPTPTPHTSTQSTQTHQPTESTSTDPSSPSGHHDTSETPSTAPSAAPTPLPARAPTPLPPTNSVTTTTTPPVVHPAHHTPTHHATTTTPSIPYRPPHRFIPPAVSTRVPPRHHEPAGGVIQQATKAILHAASATLERTPLPLILVALMVLFLIGQDIIDRRDPKLALAAAHADPLVLFSDPPDPELPS